MKKESISRHLGPKAAAAVTAIVVLLGQYLGVDVSSITALIDGGVIDLATLGALLPAPLAAAFAYFIRGAEPAPEPALGEPRNWPGPVAATTGPSPSAVLSRVKSAERDVGALKGEIIRLASRQSDLEASRRQSGELIDDIGETIDALDERVKLLALNASNEPFFSESVDEVISARPVSSARLPLSLRQNNPGAIITGSSRWQGETTPKGASYCSFATIEDGLRAQMYLLRIVYFGKLGLNTVDSIIDRWAPVKEGRLGNTEHENENYKTSVARTLGVTPSAPLDLDDFDVLSELCLAMAAVEAGVSYVFVSARISLDSLNAAYQRLPL